MPVPPLRALLGTSKLEWGPRAGVPNVDIANTRQLRGAVRRLRRHLNQEIAAVMVRGSLAAKAAATASVIHFTRSGAVPAEAHAPHDFVTLLLQSVAVGRGKNNFQRQLVTTAEPSVMARGMEALVVSHGQGILKAFADDPGDIDDAPDNEIAAWYAANVEAGTVVEVSPTAAVLQRDLRRFAVPTVPPPKDVNLLCDAAPLDLTREAGDENSGYQKVHRVYMLAAFALLKAHEEAPSVDGKFVAALLVAQDGRVLSWGLNTNKENSTHHAEVNMLQAYHARQKNLGAYTGLPPRARVYTTLQCCKMCAGMIHHCASDAAGLRVYFGAPDPGQNDGTSALQGAAPLERRLVTREGALAGIEFISSKRMHAQDRLGVDYSTRLENRMASEPGDAASKGATIAANFEHHSAIEELARKYHKYHAPNPPAHLAKHWTSKGNPHTRDAVRYALAFLAGLGLD